MPARLIALGYGLWIALLAAGCSAFPSWRPVLWALIGISSSVAVLSGVRLHRPARRLPWYLVAAALSIFAAGDVVRSLLDLRQPPSVVDVFHLGAVPLIVVALALFVRSRMVGRPSGRLLDAMVVTAGLSLLVWIFLIAPNRPEPQLPPGMLLVGLGYSLLDVVLIGTLAVLLSGTGRRGPALYALAAGGVALVVTNASFAIANGMGGELAGQAEIGWAVLHAAAGFAALHPSMADLTRRGGPARDGRLRRMVVLLAGLIPPIVLIVEDVAVGEVANAAGIAVFSAVIFILIVSRLGGVMRTLHLAAVHERALREAAASFVAAGELGEVAAAIDAAVALHLPDADTEIVLLAGTAVRAADWDATERELLPVAALDPVLAGRLARFEEALRCPLTLPERPDCGPVVGELYIGAAYRDLAALAGDLDGVLEVVMLQAALALERMTLIDQVHRRTSEAYFKSLIVNATDIIMVIDDSDTIAFASPSAAATLGDTAAAGTPVLELIEEADRIKLGQMLAQSRAGQVSYDTVDLRAIGRDGAELAVQADFLDLRADANVAGIVLTLRDVTERRRLEHELSMKALHDPLTGLANRMLFTDRTEHAVSRAGRDGSLVGVVFIDIDDFKVVNDTMGQLAGDELLRVVAARITGVLRPHDTAARLGGDEFAALIEDVDDPRDVEQVAERITAALAEPFTVNGESVHGTASLGVSTSAEAETTDELLRQADLALHLAKGGGKAQWLRYQADVHTAMMERLEMRAALDHAVHEGHFVLQYQPIVDLGTGTAVGFEALVRWHHPVRGIIPPVQFIDLAEECGLIVPIGRWVLEESLRTAAQWQRLLPDNSLKYLSVNVSARQFRDPGFKDVVRTALAESGIAPGSLMLEITESLLLRDDEKVWADLAELRALGVRIAIDDFGTGYSSLSYLRHMPIDVLKIDKSFIDDMMESKQQHAVVSAIVHLAQTLDMDVVAEGIETGEQRDTLIAMGCPYGQGYLFSRPVGATEAFGWLGPRRLVA